MAEPIVVERFVAAEPAAVYAYLTDGERWARWQGAEAVIEARPGGRFHLRMGDGSAARGEFVNLEADLRVVFTWGWIDHPGVPPGSSTVEIELIPARGGTLIRLTHTGLPEEEVEDHRAGWSHYLPRLAAVAAGSDAGPDPGPPVTG